MYNQLLTILLVPVLLAGCESKPSAVKPEDRPYSGMYPLIESGRLGFVDEAGRVVVQPRFPVSAAVAALYGDVYSEDLAPMAVGARWGFIDRAGQYAINPQFEAAEAFRDGLARVWIKGKVGFIDRQGRYVINPQFSAALDFSEGTAPVRLGEKWGYVDRDGRYVINPQFSSAHPFSNGLGRVSRDDRWGYVDAGGNYVINPQFDVAHDFAEGRAVVMTGGEYGVIDRTGKYLINPQFENAAAEFSDGLLPVRLGGKEGFVDLAGKIVINPQFEETKPFRAGLAAVRSGSDWGYIGRDGSYVINPQFAGAESFEEGLGRVQVGQKVGFVDQTGALVVQPRFDDAARRFRNGRAWVVDERGFGYVDRAGRAIRPPVRTASVTSLAQLDSLFSYLPETFRGSVLAGLPGKETSLVRSAGVLGAGARIVRRDTVVYAGAVPYGDKVYHGIVLMPGDRLTALMRAENFDSFMRVFRFRANGELVELANNDDYESLRTSRVDITSREFGIYFIEVTSLSQRGGGPYTLYAGIPDSAEAAYRRDLVVTPMPPAAPAETMVVPGADTVSQPVVVPNRWR